MFLQSLHVFGVISMSSLSRRVLTSVPRLSAALAEAGRTFVFTSDTNDSYIIPRQRSDKFRVGR